MFPVKGLSISAEKLKNETGVPTAGVGSASAPKPAKKRKRAGRPNQEAVTADNFADLWEKVIEHKGQPRKDNKRQKKELESPAGQDSTAAAAAQPDAQEQQKESSEKPEKKQKNKDKKEKRDSLAATAEPVEENGDEWGGIDDEEEAGESAEAAQPAVKEKADKKQKKQKGAGSKEDVSQQKPTDKKPKAEPPAPVSAPPAPPAPKLTPLQASMREKLISARFRHLNETLYTRPSAEAFQLFEDSPEMFTEYHEGFRRQVDVWPENPVDGYIADLKARAKVRFPPRNSNAPITASQLPLPKTHAKISTLADLGCGDAKLATALQPFASKLNLDIRSFDLQTGGSALVTRADIANLPLANDSVDVAIFCLALMGTNWLNFIEEAYRILRWRGELWVAEIKSRFTNPEIKRKGGAGGVVTHSVGNRRKTASVPPGKKDKAAAREQEEAANLADLAEHVDEVVPRLSKQQQQQETDIGAFVDALAKRGFLLNRDLGDGAVDMGNKMFVRMHFVKAAPAVKGKCAAPVPERKWTDGKGRSVAAPQKKRFIGDDEGEQDGVNEAGVLKPCVYKLR
jgi:ribosomal RNA-processing protein 8